MPFKASKVSIFRYMNSVDRHLSQAGPPGFRDLGNSWPFLVAKCKRMWRASGETSESFIQDRVSQRSFVEWPGCGRGYGWLSAFYYTVCDAHSWQMCSQRQGTPLSALLGLHCLSG